MIAGGVENASATFDQQGFAVVRGVFDAVGIGGLSHDVDRIFRQWLSENRSEYEERPLVNMHSLTHARFFEGDAAGRVRFFERIAPPKLTTLLDCMFGDGLYFHNTQLFFNPFENRRLPYWHRDLQYSPIDDAEQAREQRNMLSLHVRIPLLSETGIELIPGSHKRWDTALERDVRFERNGCRNSDALPGAVLVSLEPGDILVFDAQMLHRGVYALTAERKALDLCIGRPHPFLMRYLDDSVLPGESEMDWIKNNHWYRHARQVAAQRVR